MFCGKILLKTKIIGLLVKFFVEFTVKTKNKIVHVYIKYGFQNKNQTKLKATLSMCSSLLATCSRGVSGATLVATASASSLTL